MSTIRMVGPRVTTAVMGEVVEQEWTTLAAELDGVPQESEVGKRYLTRNVKLAFFDECGSWLAEQYAQGFWLHWGPAPCATAYFGPTDSSSNCWSIEVVKEVESSES